MNSVERGEADRFKKGEREKEFFLNVLLPSLPSIYNPNFMISLNFAPKLMFLQIAPNIYDF